MNLEESVRKGISSFWRRAVPFALYAPLAFSLGCSSGSLSQSPVPDAGKPDEEVCVDNDNDGFYATERCGRPVDCDDDNNAVFPRAREVCDYRDNDCNGKTDEGVQHEFYRDADDDGFGDAANPVKACLQPEGNDPKGKKTYVNNDHDCDDRNPKINSQAIEVCNSLDDNCNKLIDDGFNVGEACYRGIGACESSGAYICAADGLETVCSATESSPGDELCDGLDNDCDGETDEGLAAPVRVCTAGEGDCAAVGLEYKVCEGILGWSADYRDCDALPGISVVETCDYRDNDCNGTVDDGFLVGESCTNGRGDCLAEGRYVCNFIGNGVVCDAVAGEPTFERCDYRDNDCNGSIDNDFNVGEACTDGIGECFRSGEYICTAEEDGTLCTAVAGDPSLEECDGLDNNCNGEIDDDLIIPSRSCTLGVGACERTGLEYLTCLGADGWSIGYSGCDAVPGTPAEELCDRIDNDCDVSVDEDDFGNPLTRLCYTGADGTEGIGECIAGTETCVDGMYGSCEGEITPLPETCNGLDDDCNSVVDDDCSCAGSFDIDGCLLEGICSILLSDDGEVALDGSSPAAGTSLTDTGWLSAGGTSQYSDAVSHSSPLSMSIIGNGAGVYADITPAVRELHTRIWYRAPTAGADSLSIESSDHSTYVAITTGNACGASAPFEYSRTDPSISESRVDIPGVPAYEANKWYNLQIDAIGRFVAVSVDDGLSRGTACITISDDVDWSRIQFGTSCCGGCTRTSYWDDFVAVVR